MSMPSSKVVVELRMFLTPALNRVLKPPILPGVKLGAVFLGPQSPS